MNVTNHLVGLSNVNTDDVDEVVVERATIDQLHNRDVDAFLVDLLRIGPVTAAAHVDDVRRRSEEPDQRVHVVAADRPKNRRTHGDVMQVAGALPRIVGDVDVAGEDPLGPMSLMKCGTAAAIVLT